MQSKPAPFRLPPWVVTLVGTALVSWVTFGRFFFDKNGPFTIVYVVLIAIPVFLLHLLITHNFMTVYRLGHRVRRATVATLFTAWLCFALLGFVIPDRPVDSLETILTGATEPMLGLAIGIANPLGIIGIALTVTAFLFSRTDASGGKPTEDELLDAAGY